MTDPAPQLPVNVLDEALRLAAHGLPVLPIKPGQKRPPMTAWQNAATTDPHIIRNWYTGLYTNHGLGIATGHNGLFVLDIDEHNPTSSGSDTLQQLEHTHGPLPDTVEVHTGSGGRHLYYRTTTPISNNAGTKLGAGLDIRGTGGQVLAPPTIHPNGQPYVWAIGHDPDDIPIADAPDWLIQLLTTTPTPPTPPPATPDIWTIIADDGPAQRFNDTTSWPELLTADGWTHAHTDRNGEQHWTRPGKTTKDGTSATVGWNNQDVLVVFTSSLTWLPAGAYSRFGYYACRHHNGNRSKAAKQLRNTPTTPINTPNTAIDPWPTPIPLTETTNIPTFPIHVLPTWITNHITQIADDLQVAIDLPATLALGALSVATLGKTKVTYPRQRWTQPLNIYAAVALPPSAGKSPAKAAIFHPLEQLELRRLEQTAIQRAHNNTQRRILEKRQRNLEDKAAKGGDDAKTAHHELNQIILELTQLDHTPSGRLLVDDSTTEALGVALAEAGGAIAVVSSEGGVFDRIAGLYNDGIANFDLYLEAWSGGRYIVDRIKRDSIQIPSANLVVITTIQPTTLDEIGARKQFAGRGLTARFLLSMPDSNVGTRNRLRPTTATDHTTNTYNQQLTNLADWIHHNPTLLVINDEASEHFAHWDQQLEHRLAPGHDLEHLSEWVGKLRANTLRIAALLHLAHNHPGTNINLDTIQQAIEIGNYYLTHMTAIADRWGVDEAIAKAKKIIDWTTRTNTNEFSVRDLMRGMRRQFRDVEELRPALTVLTDHDWIRPLEAGPVTLDTSRGRPSTRFVVHPNAAQLSVSRVSPPQTVDNNSNSLSVSRVSPTPTNQSVSRVSRVSPTETPKNNPNSLSVSRVSRVSPKGGIQTPHPNTNKNHTHPPPPVDTRDTRDTLTTNPTVIHNPLNDPIFDWD